MRKKKKKIRPLGEITDDLEPLWFEMVCDHKLQAHEVMGLFLTWAEVHYHDCIERYMDGTRPILYGHKNNIKKDK